MPQRWRVAPSGRGLGGRGHLAVDIAGVDDEPHHSVPIRSGSGFPWPPVLLVGLVLVVSVVAVAVRSFGGEDRGPKVLTDAAFVGAANDACRAAFPPLRPQSTDRDDVVTPKATAEAAAKAADGLEALAGRLRALPVSPSDAPFVARWLDDWGTFVSAGRRYAAILDQGDIRAADQAAKAGDAAQGRADRFARSNGLTDCQLRAVFVPPPRRSPL